MTQTVKNHDPEANAIDRATRFERDKAWKLAAIAELQKRLGDLADELRTEQLNSSFAKHDVIDYHWIVMDATESMTDDALT